MDGYEMLFWACHTWLNTDEQAKEHFFFCLKHIILFRNDYVFEQIAVDQLCNG